MSLTLRQLRYALAVADEGHFGRAAARCHVSQPALSQQVRLLEEICGGPLFDRLGRTVRQTPFGAGFLDRARTLVAEADALEALAAAQRGSPGRALRLGMIPTVAPYLLPAVFPALARALPAVSVTAIESRTEALLRGLETGDVDLALIATEPPAGGPRLARAPLFADPFVLAAARDRDLAAPVDLAALPREDILLLDEGHCFRDQAIEACALRGHPRAMSFSATSLSTIVEFVANGQGVTLLPAISLGREAGDPRLAIHALAAPGAARMLSLVWRQASPFGALFAEIAAIVRAAGESLLAAPLPPPASSG